MPLNFAMSLMSVAEFLSGQLLGFLFWKKRSAAPIPRNEHLSALRVGSMPVLLDSCYIQAQPWGHQDVFFPFYFYPYWAVYIASAVSLFFICHGDLPFGALLLLRADAARYRGFSLGGPGLADCEPRDGFVSRTAAY